MQDWVREQYKYLEKNLPTDTLEYLKLVAEYEGHEHPVDFVISLIKKEIPHYKRNLRFGRWKKARDEMKKKW